MGRGRSTASVDQSSKLAVFLLSVQFRGSEFVLVFQFVQCDNIYLTVSGKLTGMVYPVPGTEQTLNRCSVLPFFLLIFDEPIYTTLLGNRSPPFLRESALNLKDESPGMRPQVVQTAEGIQAAVLSSSPLLGAGVSILSLGPAPAAWRTC